MNLEQRLDQRQTQTLVLTPQMKLAIHLLPMPLVELNAFLENQICENPLLEEPGENLSGKTPERDKDFSTNSKTGKDEIDRIIERGEGRREIYDQDRYDTEEVNKKRKYLEDITKKVPTLHEHLMRQLGIFSQSDEQKTIGETIICNMDENGYLRVSTDELASDLNTSEKDIEKVLSLIQGFSPAGVGARNLSECLMLQLKQKDKESSLAAKIIERYLADLGKKRFKQIAKNLKVSPDEVKNAAREVSHLDPKPGSPFGTCARNIVPDILLHWSKKKEYEIEINNETVPELRISSYYKKLLKDKNTPETTRDYIKKKLNQALWLVKALQQRNTTIRRVVGCIVKIQKDFLDSDNNPDCIKPLTLKEVARAVEVSESTVSRVVANKYMDTPGGICRLKQFFCGELKQDNGQVLSNENVKARIRELVQSEEPGKPLSDEAIVKALRAKGINIARRTVTKYRRLLKILPSNQRKF